jgi:hypothetical protein
MMGPVSPLREAPKPVGGTEGVIDRVETAR